MERQLAKKSPQSELHSKSSVIIKKQPGKAKTGHPYMQFERALGNQAIERMMKSQRNPVALNEQGGEPLPYGLRNLGERMWNTDLSNVRIYNNHDAQASARKIQTPAFTIGSNIIIDSDAIKPRTPLGTLVILHEMAHTIQQRGSATPKEVSIGRKGSTSEIKAAQAADRALLGLTTPLVAGSEPLQIACFDDALHRLIERLALAGVFEETYIEQIYQGNLERDYSQVPNIPIAAQLLNLSLIGGLSRFGGYQAREHFDNYEYDPGRSGWFSRDDPFRTIFQTGGPIGYIHDELQASFDQSTDNPDSRARSFRRLGNAFHAIEDFFSHSTFIELTLLGPEDSGPLLTGSVPGTAIVSMLHKLYQYTGNSWYQRQAESITATLSPTSHAVIAKDDPSHPLFRRAALLAIGFVRQVGTAINAAYQLKSQNPQEAQTGLDRVKALINMRLRPPDWSDRWWESYAPGQDPEMEAIFDRMLDRLDPTINQTVFSPFRAQRATTEGALIQPVFGIFGSQEFGGGSRVAGGLGYNLMIDPEVPVNSNALRSITPYLGAVFLYTWR